MISTTLDGKYRITCRIGAGAVGAVYEAAHTGGSRRVAIQVIPADVARDASRVSRLPLEAQTAGAIETQKDPFE